MENVVTQTEKNPLGIVALTLAILALPIGIIVGLGGRGEAIIVMTLALQIPAFILSLLKIKTKLGKVALLISIIMTTLAFITFVR